MRYGDGPGLHLLLNHYVEDVQSHGSHLAVIARNTLTGQARAFRTEAAVLAAGLIESPELLRRSGMYPWLPVPVEGLVGRGLADHPTSNEVTTFVTGTGNVGVGPDDHAKIIFYLRGLWDGSNRVRYPFILAVIAARNEPMPRKKLLRALSEAGTPHGTGTVAKALADLTREKTLINPQDWRDYRLPAWPTRGRRDQPSLPGCEPTDGYRLRADAGL